MHIFLFIFSLFFAAQAFAQTKHCATIKNDTERLACFDRNSNSAAPVKPDSKGTSSVGPALDRAKAAVRLKLNDPESAKFGTLTAMTSPNARGEPTDVICGTVNAKNAYGGYTGATPFVYSVKTGDVQIKSNASSNSDVMAMLADNIYRRFCLKEAVP